MTEQSNKSIALAAIDKMISDMPKHQSSQRAFLKTVKAEVEQSALSPQDTIVIKLSQLQDMTDEQYREQVNFNIIYAEPLLLECIENINDEPSRLVRYMSKIAGEDTLPALKHFAGNKLMDLFQVVTRHIARLKEDIHNDGMSAYFCDHSETRTREYAAIAEKQKACDALETKLNQSRQAYFTSIAECLSRA